MRITICAVLASLSWSAFASTSMNTSDVRLRVGQSIVNCTFDREKSVGHRSGPNTVSGRFTVNCKDSATPYRLVTSLSPMATLYINEKRRMNLSWFVKKDSKACEGNEIMQDATEFHSGSRQLELEGKAGVTNWFYCLKLMPKDGEKLNNYEYWPVNGEFAISLEDAKKGEWLPKHASVITITFENNSHQLSPQGEALLNSVLMNIGGPDKVNIQIHAHASDIGNQAYNHSISIMRLKKVRDWLVNEGKVDLRKTWGQAWGEEKPFAINTIDEEAPQNRRVDVVFLPKEKPMIPALEFGKATRITE